MNLEPLHYDPNRDRDRRRRREHQLRRLGARDPVCIHPECDERNPFALTGASPVILCYEHDAIARGKAWVEDHHPSGAANDPLVTLKTPGNDHRVLSDLQLDWPQNTLRNPEESPLVRAAAAIRGWLDVLWLMLTRCMGWIPPALEQLEVILTDHFGTQWWRKLGWEVTP